MNKIDLTGILFCISGLLLWPFTDGFWDIPVVGIVVIGVLILLIQNERVIRDADYE